MSSLQTDQKKAYIIIELTRTYELIFRALGAVLVELFLEGDLVVVTLVTLSFRAELYILSRKVYANL